MNFLTVVHIAGAPTETQQRCVRCSKILIDLTGCATIGGGSVGHWEPGGYVGVVRGNPEQSFAMKRDAEQDDEINCVTGGLIQ